MENISAIDKQLSSLGLPTYTELAQLVLKLNGSVTVWIGAEADFLYDQTQAVIKNLPKLP